MIIYSWCSVQFVHFEIIRIKVSHPPFQFQILLTALMNNERFMHFFFKSVLCKNFSFWQVCVEPICYLLTLFWLMNLYEVF